LFKKFFATILLLLVFIAHSAKCASQEQIYDWLESVYGDKIDFSSFSEDKPIKKVLEKIFDKAFQIETGIENYKDLLSCKTSLFFPLQEGDVDSKRKHIKLMQCALSWKGYYHGSISGKFNDETAVAVKKLKYDVLGVCVSDTSINLLWFAAILNESNYTPGNKSDKNIRKIQQYINRKYRSYCGIVPCDGLYSKRVNKAFIRILQHELNCEIDGIFGHSTTKKCPTLKFGMRGKFVHLLQCVLYMHGFKTEIDGIYGKEMSNAVKSFQRFVRLPVTGTANMSTIKALLVSTGDCKRPAIACDCAEQLNLAKALALRRAGCKYVGRYLTGGGWKNIPKYLTKKECADIAKAGLRFFPIYQDGGRKLDYFTIEQGAEDAQRALAAASYLGIPKGTIIYFAVDCDPSDDHLSDSVIPYFKVVFETVKKSKKGYFVGVYGTRKTCLRVSKAGYAKTSFVLGLSPLFNGNLGYSLPDNWAFDQFHELRGKERFRCEGGEFYLDRSAFSGRDHGVIINSFAN